MSVTTCKNCEHHFKGNFCPQCGQSAKVEPVGLRYFVHDIPHSVFHVDKGFFYTLAKLMKKPGRALSDYLAGKRVRYFRPFAFVIVMSTFCTALIKLCEYLVNLRLAKTNPGASLHFSGHFFGAYPSVLIFLLIPILSLITWLCFLKRKYNYWEHFLVNTYLAAYLNVFLLIVNIISVVKIYAFNTTRVSYTFLMFFFMSYYAHAFGGLMQEKGKFLKTFLILFIMNFFLATAYMTAFSLSGIMNPWWNF